MLYVKAQFVKVFAFLHILICLSSAPRKIPLAKFGSVSPRGVPYNAVKPMAIYEYQCKTCAAKFEAMRQMREMDAPAPCPHCQSLETMRLLSLFAAHTSSAPLKSDARDACATSAAMGVPCCGGQCGLK